jgi:RimJ/RimL family protein N-acetyltransferase
VRIEQFDAASDLDAVGALYDVYRAGAPVDEAGGPPMSFRVFSGRLVRGWCGAPRESWLAGAAGGPGEAGRLAGTGVPGDAVVGGYTLELPDRENRDRAALNVLVAPDHRRAGTGTALLQHAAARARALGRTALTGETPAGTPGDRFALATGATIQLSEARRTLDVDAIAPGYLGELRASVKEATAGYAVLDWSGPVPEAYLDPVAGLNQVMGDAPHGAEEEILSWDAARVREVGRLQVAMGLRQYSVAAREEATGELAGLTELAVDPADPEWGHQEMTAVARAHRGHRLGLLLKVAMLELLAEREPQIQRILTYNAESNQHMIAVNEALGFRVWGRLRSWLLPADAVP